ncbi:hypothetical protein H1S01_04070 [Heliobacterium chlorum]|uniref:Uncharacterized protein n=1 Tax=Heliobacterium chlorum TaxID=2698 RepID=A0ABR7T0H7_HELCL|nr:hypothetical protein [Heliobacterium chlorum]MBC9783687.1 hypothetical protein [Heliobacterium chlorum]
MSELLEILEFVRKNSRLPKLAMARLTMLLGEDVNRIDENTPSNPEKVKRYTKAAEEVTGKPYKA